MSGHLALPRLGRLPVASRRQFGRKLAAAGLALAAMPLSRQSLAGRQAVYFTWADYDNPEFFPAYVAKHGEPPIMQTFLDENEALS